jgi:coat protein Gp5
MANQFLDTNWVSMKILWILQNALEVASCFNTEWESEFGKNFPVGSSVQVKLPQRWLVTDGLGYQPQGIARLATTINLDQVFGIHFEWDSYERLVKMERSQEELEENYLKPAAVQLAQEVDSRAAKFAYQNASGVVGALGTNSTTIDFAAAADEYLYEKACPKGIRHLLVSPSQMRSYVVPNVTQFNPAPEISKMFRSGVLGTAVGWEWYRSNSLYRHTIGTAATGGVTITGANQSGNVLSVTGTSTQTFKQGDKFSIANVNGVNPSTRRAISSIQTFTVLADVTLTGGTDTINISPAIYGPGSQYQNVDALPADGAAFTIWPGTTSPSGKAGTVGLGLSKFAFAMSGGKLEVPKAVERAEQTEDPDTGMAVRFVRAWDQRESKMTNRFDMCLGFGNLYNDQGAVALAGA